MASRTCGASASAASSSSSSASRCCSARPSPASRDRRDSAALALAELCALHVDPDRWSCGIGRTLIAQARADLAAAGASEAQLWLLAGNQRARRFYERDGWSTDGTRRQDVVWGVTVDELQLRRLL